MNQFPTFRVESLEDRKLLSGSTSTVTPTPVTRVGPTNGGFEASPDFTGWQTAGNDQIQAADFHAPAEGLLQAELSTAQIPNNGKVPASAASLETFLGLSTGKLSKPGAAAVNGSAIKQNITAQAGDVLTFKADFLTNESPGKANSDYAFVTVTVNGKTQLIPLTAALKTIASPNNTGFLSETGYKTYSITLPVSGQYTIGYGAVNVGDSAGASALLVDQVQLQPGQVGGNHDHDDDDDDDNDGHGDHGHGLGDHGHDEGNDNNHGNGNGNGNHGKGK